MNKSHSVEREIRTVCLFLSGIDARTHSTALCVLEAVKAKVLSDKK